MISECVGRFRAYTGNNYYLAYKGNQGWLPFLLLLTSNFRIMKKIMIGLMSILTLAFVIGPMTTCLLSAMFDFMFGANTAEILTAMYGISFGISTIAILVKWLNSLNHEEDAA